MNTEDLSLEILKELNKGKLKCSYWLPEKIRVSSVKGNFLLFFPGFRGNRNEIHTIGYGKFRVQEWLLKAKISTSAKMTYTVLATCSAAAIHLAEPEIFG